LVAVGIVALLSAALYFTMFRSMRDDNATAQKALDTKVAENTQLEQYRPKLADMERQVANLKQQLEIERRSYPTTKNRAVIQAGGRRRRQGRNRDSPLYRAPSLQQGVLFGNALRMEIDGPYYSVLNFFDRLGKTERIVNVSDLLMANMKKSGEAKAKGQYQYAAGESVVATCVATTFFSHDLAPPPAAAKPGTPAVAGAR